MAASQLCEVLMFSRCIILLLDTFPGLVGVASDGGCGIDLTSVSGLDRRQLLAGLAEILQAGAPGLACGDRAVRTLVGYVELCEHRLAKAPERVVSKRYSVAVPAIPTVGVGELSLTLDA